MKLLTKLKLKEIQLFSKMGEFLSSKPFESVCILVLTLFFGLYILALNHLFFTGCILLLFGTLFFIALFTLSKHWRFINAPLLLLVIFLLFFAVLALTSHPIEPVASGRDQGTFLWSSVLLVENNGFPFRVPEATQFFDIYGPGKALHFPGFTYTENGSLVPEFPIGYISWLGGFYALFGLSGFAYANGLLFVLSSCLFYLVLKRFIAPNISFLATALWMGSFLPLWFLSFTLTENLAFFFFVLTVESFTRFLGTKTVTLFAIMYLGAFAFALTRIEGWALLGILTLSLLIQKESRAWCSDILTKSFAFLTLVLLFFVISLQTALLNGPYFKAIAKALFKKSTSASSWSGETHNFLSLYTVLWHYGILIVFILGAIASVYLWRKKAYQSMIPLLFGIICLPYLFFPHITYDAPWMLRRFLFVLYPAFALTLTLGFDLVVKQYSVQKQRLLWYAFFALFVFVQIPLIKFYTQTSYEQTLLPQIESISQSFTPSDLLLIDRNVTGDNFMMPSQALSSLYNRNSVYFFNPADFQKLNTESYERVFLLVPENKASEYRSLLDDRSLPIQQFVITNNHSYRDINLLSKTLPPVIKTRVLVFQLQ